MKKAVITGGTGMIGLALTKILTEKGISVLLIINPDSKRKNHLPPANDLLKIVECDLSSLAALSDWNESYDAFFHLAWIGTYGEARNNMRLQSENLNYTLDAVELAKRLGCEVFIGVGSQAEYGRSNLPQIAPSTPTFPESGYGIAKLCAGQMSRIVCKNYNIRHVWGRIFSAYGPYDGFHTMVVSGICQMLRGEIPKYTKGEQLWDYIYCDDAANALYLMAEKGKDGSVYCIGSGKAFPMKNYFFMIRDAVNPSAKIGIGEIPYYENQVMYLCADISSLTSDTGFLPETDFKIGVLKTLEWIKAEKIYEKN